MQLSHDFGPSWDAYERFISIENTTMHHEVDEQFIASVDIVNPHQKSMMVYLKHLSKSPRNLTTLLITNRVDSGKVWLLWWRMRRQVRYNIQFNHDSNRFVCIFHAINRHCVPFYQHGMTRNPAEIGNYNFGYVWDELTYLFPNFIGTTAKFGN